MEKHGHVEKPTDGYYERHHITPKSLGGTDEAANLTYLSGRAHFLAHWLLYKATGEAVMARAFFGMCDIYRMPGRPKPSSHAYNSAKAAFSLHNHMKLPAYKANAAKSATAQWAADYDGMKASNAFMFSDESHPMYMKNKVGDLHPRSRAVMTPLGRFGSVREAAKALGMQHPRVSAWCKSEKKVDFYYCDT